MGDRLMAKKKVKQIIHDCVKQIWMNEIQVDYSSYRLLKEDSLKNAFYHHLRNRLGDTFLEEHDLQIWTEFNDGPLKGTGKRADLAIVKIDKEDASDGYWGNCVDEVVALFELKFKATYTAVQDILGDVDKLRRYIEDDQVDCQYYLVAIREIEAAELQYIDDQDLWAREKVTELLASYSDECEMEFTIIEH